MVNKSTTMYALVNEATLGCIGGLWSKTIEIRRLAHRGGGRILIHAAGVSDPRDEAWKHVTPDLKRLVQLKGGIIGAAELTDCRQYADLPSFVADQSAHLNEPSWFAPPHLFGFVFTKPEIRPFVRFPGWFRFFKVDWPHDLQLCATAPR